MILSYDGLRDRAAWLAAGVRLPNHDWKAMREETDDRPIWAHIGMGALFRAYIALLQQRLFDAGEAKTGIVAAELSDGGIIDSVFTPHDCMTLAVHPLPNGGMDMCVVASVARALATGVSDDWNALRSLFRHPSLQMATFTIGEAAYAVTDARGELLPEVMTDIVNGPLRPRHPMGVAAALLLERYYNGKMPIAFVSLDCCARCGDRLRESVLTIAREWLLRGLVPPRFIGWLEDKNRVSFPLTLIDDAPPLPADGLEARLNAMGLDGDAPVVVAPSPRYIVIEDRFPNGRPALQRVGVHMLDRDVIERLEGADDPKAMIEALEKRRI